MENNGFDIEAMGLEDSELDDVIGGQGSLLNLFFQKNGNKKYCEHCKKNTVHGIDGKCVVCRTQYGKKTALDNDNLWGKGKA